MRYVAHLRGRPDLAGLANQTGQLRGLALNLDLDSDLEADKWSATEIGLQTRMKSST